MSFVKVWIHAVWGTKYRQPLLAQEVRIALFQHIRENAQTKGIYVDFINGYTDHVHVLLRLNAETSISKTIQLLKGESAFWVNKNHLLQTRPEWADEYFAVSVSESIVDKVRDYIRRQEERHRKMTWQEEYNGLMRAYGFINGQG